MTDVRIQTFPIPGLEYVFVPPGLPLVTKSDNGPTTSILVRGGAGTGKTTLAVALAHAISKAREGVTLYLSTEFVATEIAYKVAALHLPESSVVPWDTAGQHETGTIFARHLLQTREGENEQNLQTVGARKRAAIAAVWESLTTSGEPSASRPEGPPVQAVVIDAFGLPEADGEDPGLRNELLTLVQSLEYMGITVILVEEANSPVQTWLSFVVDIVFEIDLSSDDSGNPLLRRFKCPKSRYGQALPGPHDYGLDVSMRPAVWPDLAFSNTLTPLWDAKNLAPTFFVPHADNFGLYPAGCIIVSDWSDKHPFWYPFVSLPGMKAANMSCGPLTTVAIDNDLIRVGEGQGILAVAWSLIQARHAGRINAVRIQDFEFFLTNPLTRARSLRAVTMLSASGLSVCLHGDVEALSAAAVIADCVQGGKYSDIDGAVSPRPRFCRADRWLPRLVNPTADSGDAFEFALTEHIGGAFNNARAHAKSNLTIESEAKFLMLIGHDVAAAALVYPAPRYPAFIRMWAHLAAIHAGNTGALENLENDLVSLDVYDAISLLRALAAHQRFDRLSEVLDEFRTRWNLPEWYAARLRAELLVSTPGKQGSMARALLDELAKSDEVPKPHRAEIWYNIGQLDARDNMTAAQTAWGRAQELNPHIDFENEP